MIGVRPSAWACRGLLDIIYNRTASPSYSYSQGGGRPTAEQPGTTAATCYDNAAAQVGLPSSADLWGQKERIHTVDYQLPVLFRPSGTRSRFPGVGHHHRPSPASSPGLSQAAGLRGDRRQIAPVAAIASGRLPTIHVTRRAARRSRPAAASRSRLRAHQRLRCVPAAASACMRCHCSTHRHYEPVFADSPGPELRVDLAFTTNIPRCRHRWPGVAAAAEILAEAAIALGHDAKKTEVAGMAQRGRGGFVSPAFPRRCSPQITPGTADVLLGFEAAEGIRWRTCCSPGHCPDETRPGWWPPVVELRLYDYGRPHCRHEAAGTQVIAFDATTIALDLGDIRLGNTASCSAPSPTTTVFRRRLARMRPPALSPQGWMGRRPEPAGR